MSYALSLLFILVSFFFLNDAVYGFAMVGGPSQERAATPEIQELALRMKIQAEGYLNRKEAFGMFTAVSYRSQVVAGTNYFIKVQVGKDVYIHLRVYQPLPYTGLEPAVVAVLRNKKKGDKIEYFEKDEQ